jgi:hypothetical protein
MTARQAKNKLWVIASGCARHKTPKDRSVNIDAKVDLLISRGNTADEAYATLAPQLRKLKQFCEQGHVG